MSHQNELFQSKLVPAKAGADQLFEEEFIPSQSRPVICLGRTFENEDARRAFFTQELRTKLLDPEFRKIEGFPIGSDEDILKLSDPPYYTACPNPWIADFIAEWESQKPQQPKDFHYHREPFAADVSEGKNDPIYNAHSYHTKVPHKAIMRYILHYTEPGDIVFDGFCGTGMTGVASQMCGDREAVMSLGYQVKPDGTILQEDVDADGKNYWKPFSKLGSRHAVLNDLSPVASYISRNYTDLRQLVTETKLVLNAIDDLEKELDSLYQITNFKVMNGIWSDVFVCPNCSEEVIFWEAAVEDDQISKSFKCPSCKAKIGKAASRDDGTVKLDRAFITTFDPIQNSVSLQPKFVLISETIKTPNGNKRVDTDKDRREWLDNNCTSLISNTPLYAFENGRQTNKLINGSGIHYAHQMYTPRSLAVYSRLWALDLNNTQANSLLRFCLSGINNYISRKQGYFGGGGGVAGTLFTPSIHLERNVFDVLRRKLKKIALDTGQRTTIVSCQSTSSIFNRSQVMLDYIFIDPPFGENLQYAELNSFVESWLRVKTYTSADCVLNYVHKKTLKFYGDLMRQAFEQCYKSLKPGRWMTVEFSNTQASIWNAIQDALQAAGFIVANVSSLDRRQLQFNAVNNPVSVKQDLIISAYKPGCDFEDRFRKEALNDKGVWDFVRNHLKYLPVTKRQRSLLNFISERDPRILFDQMVAYYVRKGYPIPISSQEFQAGLTSIAFERDGMYFLPDQVEEYDRNKVTSGQLAQMTIFVSDEASAIQWLRQLIKEKPQSISDITPQFMQQLGGYSKNEQMLELSTLLEQNFFCYDGKELVPEQIHAYLSSNWKDMRNLPKDDPTLVAKARDRWYLPDPNKAGNLDKLREKALLREFEDYKQANKKLKVFRLEAVRAGFKSLWQQQTPEAYKIIKDVAEKIPNDVLEEDPKLLMWYDQAVTRLGGE